MKLWNDHVEYLRDNPNGYWFKRKRYGLGWTPAKPAGWITIFSYILFIIGVFHFSDMRNFYVSSASVHIIVLIVVATLLFLAVMWRTGEPLKWQWGKKKDEE
ncbi:MAG: hypothetical protein H6782_01345 [Candidatus Nomurabacteria bacterium]|nr:MAG: hypothetical protein H6782_01345 [Candidatus Nomurabacteria bacterium]